MGLSFQFSSYAFSYYCFSFARQSIASCMDTCLFSNFIIFHAPVFSFTHGLLLRYSILEQNCKKRVIRLQPLSAIICLQQRLNLCITEISAIECIGSAAKNWRRCIKSTYPNRCISLNIENKAESENPIIAFYEIIR